MACRKVQIPSDVGEILAHSDDGAHADRPGPLENLGPVRVKQGVAQMGMGIYKAEAAHER
jgi:hypothetical protein